MAPVPTTPAPSPPHRRPPHQGTPHLGPPCVGPPHSQLPTHRAPALRAHALKAHTLFYKATLDPRKSSPLYRKQSPSCRVLRISESFDSDVSNLIVRLSTIVMCPPRPSCKKQYGPAASPLAFADVTVLLTFAAKGTFQSKALVHTEPRGICHLHPTCLCV